MLRYLRLYLYFLRFSFSRAMEFRVDFFFRIGMDIVWNVVHLAFFTLVFRQVGLLAGFDRDQIYVFVGAMFVVDAVHMSVFSNNMWWLPILVNRGDLDYYLVRPVSSLFFMSVRDFAANSFVNLLIAIGVLVWAVARYPHPLGAGPLAFFAAMLGVGVFVQYAIHMLFLIPVFWLHSAHGLKEVYFSLSSLSARPHRIFTGWVGRLIVTALPFAFVVSYPVETLFRPVTPGLLLHVAAIVAVCAVAVGVLWRIGLRSYASASS
jgi:ABC-2 type transport system permease protein